MSGKNFSHLTGNALFARSELYFYLFVYCQPFLSLPFYSTPIAQMLRDLFWYSYAGLKLTTAFPVLKRCMHRSAWTECLWIRVQLHVFDNKLEVKPRYMQNKAFCLLLVHGVIVYLPHHIACFASKIFSQQSTGRSLRLAFCCVLIQIWAFSAAHLLECPLSWGERERWLLCIF